MIDRNFVLALAASMLLVVFYNLYYQWRFGDYMQKQADEQAVQAEPAKAEKAPPAPVPSTPEAAPIAEDTAAGEPSPAPLGEEAAPPATAGVERTITIKTGVAQVTLSTRGAVIGHYRLEKYKDVDGQMMDLVFDPAKYIKLHGGGEDRLEKIGGYPALGLKFPKDSFSRKINGSNFSSDETRGEIDIEGQDSPLAITFELHDDSGVVVRKTYTFHPGSHMFGLSVEVKSTARWGDFGYSLVWHGLGEETGEEKAAGLSYHGPVVMANAKREAEAPEDDAPKKTYKGEVAWAALVNRYYAAAAIPAEPKGASLTARYIDEGLFSLEWGLRASGGGGPANFEFYVGPKEHATLGEYKNGMYSLVDYGWFDVIAKPLFWVMEYFHRVSGNWGWSIIALTVIMKLLFFPLTQKGFKSMQKLQKIQPHLKKLQETYKDDKEQLNRELMNLYREHKVNPLGGCLPMVLQIPIFFALYKVLLESIELKGAGWILWIKDLSQHDPYYVTPVLMGISMLIQQLMTPKTGDPMQRKMMMALPFVFTFLFLTFPSGLVIYWLVNNILTIGQQWVIYREREAT